MHTRQVPQICKLIISCPKFVRTATRNIGRPKGDDENNEVKLFKRHSRLEFGRGVDEMSSLRNMTTVMSV